MCRPASSVKNNNSNANTTMTQVVKPFFGRKAFVEEFLPLGQQNNAHVDRQAMMAAARGENGKGWMARNYVERLRALEAMRAALGCRKTVVWAGGPVAEAALKTGGYFEGGVEVSRDHQVIELRGGRSVVVSATQHPSLPLLGGGSNRCPAAPLRSGVCG